MSRRNFNQQSRMERRNFHHPGRDFNRFHKNRRRDKAIFGILIAVLGIGLLLKTLGLIPLAIVFSWPVILILIGIFIAIKSRFHNIAWLVLIFIGVANLTPRFMIMGHSSSQLVWPVMLILGGIAIALRPPRHPGHWKEYRDGQTSGVTAENTINIDVTFGGRKEIVTSKDFQGGTISTTFGGCEVNLMQAESSRPTIIIDIKASFAGIELIVPSHWDVQNEINPSFASVEDERTMQTATATEERKTLILRGTCSFGNVEIKSY